MTREAVTLDLDPVQAPELARLAREVRRTRLPIVLRENDEDVAVLSPVPVARPPRRLLVDTSALPPVPRRAVRELAGFAGSFTSPRSREEIEAIVEEERAATVQAPDTVIADAVFVLSSKRLYNLPRARIRDGLAPLVGWRSDRTLALPSTGGYGSVLRRRFVATNTIPSGRLP